MSFYGKATENDQAASQLESHPGEAGLITCSLLYCHGASMQKDKHLPSTDTAEAVHAGELIHLLMCYFKECFEEPGQFQNKPGGLGRASS